MTVSYAVNVDEVALKDAISVFEFVGGNTDNALRIAINKTAPKIKTASSRAIRDQVRLSASYVGERLVVKQASRAKLTGSISSPSRGLLLSRFSTDATIAGDKTSWLRAPATPKAGIKVKVKPSGSAKLVNGIGKNKAFYIVLKNSHSLGIASRVSTGGRKIKVSSGPSLSQVFNTVRGDVLPQAGDELESQLLDAMRFILVKQYPSEAVL